MEPGAIVVPVGGIASNTKFGPFLGIIGNFAALEFSLFIGGDSIPHFSVDTFANGLGGTSGGIYVRGCHSGGAYLPHINLACGGAQAVVSTFTKRLVMAAYCTHAIVNLGTNDIGLHPAIDPATILAANRAVWAAFAGMGCKVSQSLVMIRTTGAFTSAAGQTIRAGFDAGEPMRLLNTEVASNVGLNGLRAVLDLNSGIYEDPSAPGKWRSDGGVAYSDGTHPSGNTSLELGAAALRAHYAAF